MTRSRPHLIFKHEFLDLKVLSIYSTRIFWEDSIVNCICHILKPKSNFENGRMLSISKYVLPASPNWLVLPKKIF